MAAYLFEPPASAAPTYDYGTVYGNISTYLNQVRQELASIDTDTTAMEITLVAIAASLATMATNSTTMANNSTTIATNTTTIANNSTTIATNSTTIAEKQTIIAEKQTAMETYQKRLKELGEGTGIHVLGPYEWFGLISIYKLMIEQGKVLDDTDNVSVDQIIKSKEKAEEFLSKISNLPTMFGTAPSSSKVTFNGSSVTNNGNINPILNRIVFADKHNFANGTTVKYTVSGDPTVGGLIPNNIYYVRVIDEKSIQLYSTVTSQLSGTGKLSSGLSTIVLTPSSGTSHTLTLTSAAS